MKKFKLEKSHASNVIKSIRFSEELKNGNISISVAHTYEDVNNPELHEFVEEMKASFEGIPFFVCDPLPLFIACHTGPNAVGVGYVVDHINALETK